jgi:hypothetical protein
LQGIGNSFNALFAFSLVKDIFEEPALQLRAFSIFTLLIMVSDVINNFLITLILEFGWKAPI